MPLAEAKPWVGLFHPSAEIVTNIQPHASKFPHMYTCIVFLLPERPHILGDLPSYSGGDHFTVLVFHEPIANRFGGITSVGGGFPFRVTVAVVLFLCPVVDGLEILPLRLERDGPIGLGTQFTIGSLGIVRWPDLGDDDLEILDVGPDSLDVGPIRLSRAGRKAIIGCSINVISDVYRSNYHRDRINPL